MVAQRRKSTYQDAGVGGSEGTTPQPLEPSSSGIWTTYSSREFHKRVKTLEKELCGKLPEEPIDYREIPRNTNTAVNYTLLYEEELHLADHFAFISAKGKKKQDSVSATVLEERRDPPGLILRLASNQTPTRSVTKGLKSIIKLIQDHAEAGTSRELHEGRLLHAIVEFSQPIIYERLRCLRSSRGKIPLHIRVNEKLADLFFPPKGNAPGLAILQKELISVTSTLAEIDETPEKQQLVTLKEIVKQCHNISNDGISNSFEKRLKSLGAPWGIYQSAEVRQIDKLGKYWQMCLDFSRRGRQPRTRNLFRNFELDVLTAPLPTAPHGLGEGEGEECKVHGEVQLVLFYERNAIANPPRAIGSSKSACYLCDQFVKLHGQFGISHSHMNFYSKWTIPDSTWMNPGQQMFFRGLVGDMSAKLKTLARKRNFHTNYWGESKANVCEKVDESSIAPSDIGEQVAPATLDFGLNRPSRSSSLSTIRPSKPVEEDSETTITPPAETSTPTHNSPIQQPNLAGQPIKEEEKLEMSLEENNPPRESRRETQKHGSPSPSKREDTSNLELEEKEPSFVKPTQALLMHQNSRVRKQKKEPEPEPEENVPHTKRLSPDIPMQSPPFIPSPHTHPPLPRRRTKKHHKYRNLPLSFPILPSTRSFDLTTKSKGHKKVRYTFDLEEITHGKVEIFESKTKSKTKSNTSKREFDVNFGRKNSGNLKVVITWEERRKNRFWTRLPSSLSSWWHGGMREGRRGKERG